MKIREGRQEMLDIKIVDDLTQHNLGVLSKHTRHEKNCPAFPRKHICKGHR